MSNNKLQLPKIAMGAWAWGNDGTFGGTLTEKELRPCAPNAVWKGGKLLNGASEASLKIWVESLNL